jgi:peptidoglycan hydrolase CwlO-like protein
MDDRIKIEELRETIERQDKAIKHLKEEIERLRMTIVARRYPEREKDDRANPSSGMTSSTLDD